MFKSRYSGITIPRNSSLREFCKIRSDKEIIQSSVRMILLTNIGERVMLPDFGSRVMEGHFEPNDDILGGLSTASVEEALRKWETRINVMSVTAIQRESTLIVRVVYQPKLDETDPEQQVVDVDIVRECG